MSRPPAQTSPKGPHRRDDDDGIAMIMVIMLSTVMLLVPLAISTSVLGQFPLARHDQNYTAALAAADAGVQDFVNRLNANTNYWQTALANTTSNTAPSPSDGNKALTGWVNVSSVVPTSLVEGYCYTVDQTGTSGSYTTDSTVSSSQGIVELRVYGYAAAGGSLPGTNPGANPCVASPPVAGVERVINVDLRQKGFLDYLELTDLQLVDQAWYDKTFNTNYSDCANYTNTNGTQNFAYQYGLSSAQVAAGDTHATDCGNLANYWGTGNVLNGPLRSNDDYFICGTADFKGTVYSDDPNGTTYGNGGKYWSDPAGGCDGPPTFEKGGQVYYGSGSINFPTQDSSVSTYAKATGTAHGCYYVGPTDIQLLGSTMNVVSPETNATDSPNYGSCVGNGVAVPPDGVIYADNGAVGVSGVPNCQTTFSGTALSDWISSANQLPQGDVCSSTNAPGDVFVQGKVTGGLTVVSAENIFITGDLTYTNGLLSPSTDVLGLISQKYIEVEHPVDSFGHNIYGAQTFYGTTSINAPADWNNTLDGATAQTNCKTGAVVIDCNLTVDAAMLSLNDSLGVQNFGRGAPFGTLTMNGALAEEYMDIEGIFGNCGYTTQGVATDLCDGTNSVYSYDSRLAHLSPPHFLSPTYAQWKEINYEECPMSGCSSYPAT